MRRPAVLAAALLLVVASCGGDDDPAAAPSTTSTTTTTEADGTTTTTTTEAPATLEWSDCDGLECATLTVPLDHAEPDGDTIDVDVVRAPATGDDREGALFVNPGGPGGSTVDLVGAAGAALPEEITERFDIVGVEPRGVGPSTALDCGIPVTELYAADPTIDSPEDSLALLATSEAYVDDCEEEAGDLLPHIGTRNVARDMDAVRAALGDEQISYLGLSYGTSIGQVYADLFPERVRAMVLDGVVQHGPTGLEAAAQQAAGFELAVGRFVEDCDADADCPLAPDTRSALDRVVAAAEGVVPAPEADRDLGPGEVSVALAYAMYSDSLWPDLAGAVAEALDGDGSGLVALADGYLGAAGFQVYFAVSCIDSAWPDDAAEVMAAAVAAAEASPTVGEALVNDYVRCALWPVEPDPLEPTDGAGTPPILVVSTTGDPATPYEAGVAVAEQLTDGVLVTHEGEGHTVTFDGDECISDILVAYLVDLEPPTDGVTCG